MNDNDGHDSNNDNDDNDHDSGKNDDNDKDSNTYKWNLGNTSLSREIPSSPKRLFCSFFSNVCQFLGGPTYDFHLHGP